MRQISCDQVVAPLFGSLHGERNANVADENRSVVLKSRLGTVRRNANRRAALGEDVLPAERSQIAVRVEAEVAGSGQVLLVVLLDDEERFAAVDDGEVGRVPGIGVFAGVQVGQRLDELHAAADVLDPLAAAGDDPPLDRLGSPRLGDGGQIQVGGQHARLVVVQLPQHLAPGTNGEGSTPGAAAVLVEAALGRRQHEAAGLDRPGAQQGFPVRLARGPGEGRRRDDHLRARQGQGPVEGRESHVVADGEAQLQLAGPRRHGPVAQESPGNRTARHHRVGVPARRAIPVRKLGNRVDQV